MPRRQAVDAAWEVRAAVDEETYAWVEDQAERHGRSVRRHVGIMVVAIARLARRLPPHLQAQLDHLLRQPENVSDEALRALLESNRNQI